jgi:hypothetical protein
LRRQGRDPEAEECFSEAVRIDPEYEEAKHSLEDVRLALAFQREWSHRDYVFGSY